MKLSIATDFTMHYLSILSTFIRRYFRYNSNFNTAITGHKLISESYKLQVDDNSVSYSELSGVSTLFLNSIINTMIYNRMF